MLVTPSHISLPLDSVPEGAFRDCTALERAEFELAEIIGYQAFYRCSALTRAEFGSVQTIDVDAFRGCPFQPEVPQCS